MNGKIAINIRKIMWCALTPKALGFAHKGQIMRLLISGFAALLLNFPLYAQDQFLLVSNREGRDILRFDAKTGAFIDVLIKAGSGNMNVPMGMAIGLDGNLYVSSYHAEIFPRNDPCVLKFDSQTGEFLGTFGSAPSNAGLGFIDFGPDGNLYVGDGSSATAFRFDGKTGESLGVFATGVSGESYWGLVKSSMRS